MKSVTIIGAGIGGLCTGVSLLLEGYDVSIYEKTDAVGGVLRSITSPDGAFRFEESASIPINPNTYHEYLKKIGLSPKEYFEDKKLKTFYHVYYEDRRALYVPHDLRKMREVLNREFKGEIEGYDRFMRTAMKKYNLSKKYFINRYFIKASSIFGGKTLYRLVKLNPIISASSFVRRFIKSKEIRDFILFQAFFMGISPKKLPNIYTTVYANSQIEGISHINGGLSHYARVLAKIFEDKGGKIYYNAPVQRIYGKGSLVTGVRVGNSTISSDIVIVNADYCYAQKVLLGRKIHRYTQLSCSAFIVHLGLTKKYTELGVHNLFISKRFEEEIENIFKGKLPQNPPLYIYSPSIIDDSYCKNASQSVLNIMVRVPNLKDLPISWDDNTREKILDLCLQSVATISGLENIKEHIVYKSCTTPIDFKDRYNLRYGCCFGIGHTLFQSMALRPQVMDKTYQNLYYVGSSIHPGNGASIVMNCAEIVKETIENH